MPTGSPRLASPLSLPSFLFLKSLLEKPCVPLVAFLLGGAASAFRVEEAQDGRVRRVKKSKKSNTLGYRDHALSYDLFDPLTLRPF